MVKQRSRSLAMICFVLAACGTGGGGNGDGSDTVGSQAPPVVISQRQSLAIVFPPPRSATESKNIVVRGTAEGLATIVVNGIPATVANDTWTAEVPLAPGDNTVAVVGTGADGATHEHRLEVDRAEFFFRQAQDVVYDELRHRLFVMDGQPHALVEVHPDTGARRVIYRWTNEPEPAKWWWAVKTLELDAARRIMYVLRPGGNLDILDLETGKVTRAISDFFVQPRALALDHDTGTLYVADRFECRMYEWNPTMAAPRIISDLHTGGTDLHFRDIYWDSVRKRIVIAGQGRAGGAVIAIDMKSGYRSDLRLGIQDPDTVSYDPILDLAVFSDEPAIRTWTPGQTKVSERVDDDNITLLRWSSIAVRPGTSDLFLVSTDQDGVFRLDRNNGRILPLAAETVGDGVPLGSREGESIADIAWDAARKRTVAAIEYRQLYAWSYPASKIDSQHALIAIDARGNRTVVAADASALGKKETVAPRGDGPRLGELAAVAVDTATNRLIALSVNRARLLAIDPITGDRSEIAGSKRNGARWNTMAVDPQGRRAAVATNHGEVLLINLDLGTIDTVALESVEPITAMALLPGEERVFVADGVRSSVDTIDLRNGRRFLFATEPQGRPVLDLHADPENRRVVVVCPGELGMVDGLGRFAPLGNSTPDAFFPADSRRVCIDPAAGCAFVTTRQDRASVRGLFAVDLITGQCVIASKD